MRCVIARYPFDLSRCGVTASMKGVTPEIVTGESVTVGRRRYPVKQAGQVITRQDRRDFTGGEVIRALTRRGFTCHARSDAAPVRVPLRSRPGRQCSAPPPWTCEDGRQTAIRIPVRALPTRVGRALTAVSPSVVRDWTAGH